jgi:hypothetical protein
VAAAEVESGAAGGRRGGDAEEAVGGALGGGESGEVVEGAEDGDAVEGTAVVGGVIVEDAEEVGAGGGEGIVQPIGEGGALRARIVVAPAGHPEVGRSSRGCCDLQCGIIARRCGRCDCPARVVPRMRCVRYPTDGPAIGWREYSIWAEASSPLGAAVT